MNRGSLKRKIEKRLEKLAKILDKIEDLRAIESGDPETWDSDSLYDLGDLFKEAQEILEDKVDRKQKDQFGYPVILENGLCSLVDEYHEEEESNDYDE